MSQTLKSKQICVLGVKFSTNTNLRVKYNSSFAMVVYSVETRKILGEHDCDHYFVCYDFKKKSIVGMTMIRGKFWG